MARGRRPDPEAVKIAKGSKRSARASAVDGTAELRSSAPKNLSASAKRVWDALAPELGRLKFLRDTDRDAFARYCEHASRWWALTKDLRSEGDTYWTESAHGKMQRLNPKFMVRERIENRLESLEDRFGLNPAARQQILQRLAALPPSPLGGLFTAGVEENKTTAPSVSSVATSPIGMLRSNIH